jgi:hypothetical protein
VARNACLMYTHNGKRRKWFDRVTLIVWGPAAQLESMIARGVKVEACLACADRNAAGRLQRPYSATRSLSAAREPCI